MGALYRLLSENSHPRPDGHHSAHCHFVHLCTHYRGHYGAGAVRKREGFKADCAFLHLDLPRHMQLAEGFFNVQNLQHNSALLVSVRRELLFAKSLHPSEHRGENEVYKADLKV